MEDIEQLARRVIVVNHGEIVFDDSIASLKGFLGAKKSVKVTTESEADWNGIAGVTTLKQESPMETELELDTDKLPLKDFIRIVNERYTILDMALEALPIERIIKELYQENDAEHPDESLMSLAK
ncbi:hypothetical protein D3C75_1093880 [compost metagenome]